MPGTTPPACLYPFRALNQAQALIIQQRRLLIVV
jgi:hypothetical protein